MYEKFPKQLNYQLDHVSYLPERVVVAGNVNLKQKNIFPVNICFNWNEKMPFRRNRERQEYIYEIVNKDIYINRDKNTAQKNT